MVPGRVDLHQAALQPGRAALDEWDAIGPQPVGYLALVCVDRGRATGKSLSDELLGASENAHVECSGLDYRGPGGRLTLEPDKHQRRIHGD